MVKDVIRKVAYAGGDPDEVIEKIAKTILPQIRGQKANPETTEGIGADTRTALMVFGLETHFPLSETVEKKLRPQVIEFSRQLIEEYDCTTSGEKALAQTIVSAYARILIHSGSLNAGTAATHITKAHIGFYSMLSKELDRANRHFITALTTLKQLKAPSLEINIKARTAFVAQNQQINTDQNPNKKKNEIIDPK